jgi:hypothetical protein
MFRMSNVPGVCHPGGARPRFLLSLIARVVLKCLILLACLGALEGDPGVKANVFRGEVIPIGVVFEKPGRSADALRDGRSRDPGVVLGNVQIGPDPARRQRLRQGRQAVYLQATGQPEFPLEAASATRFEFARAGFVVEFDSSSNFPSKQGGGSSRSEKAVAQSGGASGKESGPIGPNRG